jgi:hypothetical protein
VTVALSVATVAVGVWLLVHGHAAVAACSGLGSQYTSSPLYAVCHRATSSYLLGVFLTLGGAVVLLLVLIGLHLRARARNWQDRLPEFPEKLTHRVSALTH